MGNKSMSEEKESGWFGRFLGFVFSNPVSLICLGAIVYCAVQAYVLNNSPFMYKAAMAGVVVFWLFLFIAKNMFKLVVLLLIAGGIAFGWFYFTGRDKKACEESGGFWNKNTMTCEEKVSWWKQAQKFFKIDAK